MVLRKKINGEEYYCFKEHEYYSIKNTIENFNIFIEKQEIRQLKDNLPNGGNH